MKMTRFTSPLTDNRNRFEAMQHEGCPLLRIETLPEDNSYGVAFEFEIFHGKLDITEMYESASERYADHTEISIPPRVWKIAAPWIAEHFK